MCLCLSLRVYAQRNINMSFLRYTVILDKTVSQMFIIIRFTIPDILKSRHDVRTSYSNYTSHHIRLWCKVLIRYGTYGNLFILMRFAIPDILKSRDDVHKTEHVT